MLHAHAFSLPRPHRPMPPQHPRRLPYERDGLCVVRTFLPPADFALLRDECRRLRGKMKREKNSMATGRVGCFIDRRSPTHQLLTSAAVRARVARLVGQPVELSDCPIELRSYRKGAQMPWHRDDQLYDHAQCEVVICVDNDTDSRTEWIDAQGRQRAEWTPPNMALLVRGGATGAAHRVTPVKRGERTILKMVWAAPGSTPLPSFCDHLDALPGLRARVRRSVERGRHRSGKRRTAR